MAATGFEIMGSRKISNEGVERQYRVEGAADEGEVADFVATLPLDVADFPMSDFDAQEIAEVQGDYDLTVKWGQSDTSGAPTAGSSGYRFSFQAPSGHIYQSLATTDIVHDPALLPFGAASFGGAINVVWDDGKQRVEGFNLQAPPEVFSIPYTDVSGVIDLAYQATVRNLCGKVNNTTFYGAAAGEIMLVRASGERKGGLWNLEFGFAYIANATNIPVGDVIVVPAKDGMDLLWAYYLPSKDDTAKELGRQPAAAFVERVFERADLNDLNLP